MFLSETSRTLKKKHKKKVNSAEGCSISVSPDIQDQEKVFILVHVHFASLRVVSLIMLKTLWILLLLVFSCVRHLTEDHTESGCYNKKKVYPLMWIYSNLTAFWCKP